MQHREAMMTALRTSLLALALLAIAPAAHAAAGAPKPNYVTFHVEALRSVSPFPANALPGLSVDWGFFQNKYVATGTRIALQRDVGDSLGTAVMLLGGPQFHIPLGDSL